MVRDIKANFLHNLNGHLIDLAGWIGAGAVGFNLSLAVEAGQGLGHLRTARINYTGKKVRCLSRNESLPATLSVILPSFIQ